jgi:peptidoglycan/LPS O-acetylase OafA/YrhL
VNPSSPPERRSLPALTGLRFFLALWVVVFHLVPGTPGLAIPWWPQAPDSVNCVLRTGYVAVMVFFVLSGFVLAYNYDLRKPWHRRQCGRFAIARFARIYPAYFIGLLSLLPVAIYRLWEGLFLGDYELSKGLLNLFLLQAWVPHAALSWNYPGWSLSCEAAFYAAFPLLGFLLWKVERRGKMIIVLGLLWGLCLAAPLVAVFLPIHGFGDVAAAGGMGTAPAEFWADLISYNPLAGLPAFCAGIVLARFYRSLPEDSRWFGRGDWLSIPAVILIFAVLANADRIPLTLVHNGLLLPVYAVLVLGLALGGGVLARLLALSPLVFLGNASYAMYILHFPIAEWLLLATKFFSDRAFDGIAWVAFYTFMVTVGSSVFYKFAEEPLHRRIRKSLQAA